MTRLWQARTLRNDEVGSDSDIDILAVQVGRTGGLNPAYDFPHPY